MKLHIFGFINVHVVCEHCGVVMKVIVMKALSCFANTLLNNYSKDKCEDIITSKVSRKLAKFDLLSIGLHCARLIVGLLYT